MYWTGYQHVVIWVFAHDTGTDVLRCDSGKGFNTCCGGLDMLAIWNIGELKHDVSTV